MLTVAHLAVSAALAAISTITAPLPQQAATDSAGVRVVFSRPGDLPADSWRLAPTPDVEIGVANGAPEYLLDRVSAATFLASGNVVLANSDRQLRFYDRTGRHIRSVGGVGQGPGEFVNMTLVGAFAGDSLLAWDPGQRRLTVFDSAGKLGRTQSITEAVGPAPIAAGVLRNGRFVALRRDVPILRASPPPGVMRPQGTLITVGGDGATTTLGTFPDTELSIYEQVTFGVIFGRTLHQRARGDRIAVGNTDAYSIRVYSDSGQLLHLVRQIREPIAVTAADFEKARPAAFPPSPVGARMRAAVDQMPLPASYPAFGELRFDAAGNLWVQDFARDWDQQRFWQIFGPDGRLVGRLSLPVSHTLLDASQTHALVRVIDELEVQRVRVYRLQK